LFKEFRSSRTSQVLIGAFAFKSLASGITIYSVTARTAIELAPASSLLISKFGVISASIIVNILWLGAVIVSFSLIERKILDPKMKQLTLELALLFIIGITGFDGLWDLAVFLAFNVVYVISIVVLTASVISIYVLKQLGRTSIRNTLRNN
jgi:hypothetical protein